MVNDGRYVFQPEECRAYEKLPFALGVFQYVNGRVVTLLVSDGLCGLTGMNRAALVRHFDESMFGNVHPDDVERLARLGYRFATKGGPYDIVYRTKLYGKNEYRYVHTIGKYLGVGDGARVAFLTYTDITDSQQKLIETAREIDSPKVRFLEENIGAMIVVSRRDQRLFYFNKAVCRLLAPKVAYDSGMTFQQYFYGDRPNGIKGLFDAVDVGPREVEEPYTGRKLEVNVISSTWNDDPAYIVYFYEYVSGNQRANNENELRHRRVAFNSAILSGNSNGLRYYENGYKGFRVWNLSRDKMMLDEGCALLYQKTDSDISFDDYRARVAGYVIGDGDRAYVTACETGYLAQLFENGTSLGGRTFTLQTSKGRIAMFADLLMMRSPDTGELYLKISEENVTDEVVIDTLIVKTVEQGFDYVAYVDLLADRCRVIYGRTDGKRQKNYTIRMREYSCTPSGLAALNRLFGCEARDLDELVRYIVGRCGENGEFSEVRELPDSSVKSIFFQIIDDENQIYYARCTDVTELLKAEMEREKELESAKNSALVANQRLQEAVQAERNKVERVLMQTVLSISNALDARDGYTQRHSQWVAQYSSEIARRLSWPEERVQNLYNMALVHDIGKIGIPDALLQKNERLTDEEYEAIKQHVVIGGNILKDFKAIDKVSEGALYHHERYDGKGYARGLRGEEILIEARIICIADAVDAMNSTRPYRESQNIDYIKGELKKGSGSQFDPSLVEIALGMIDDGILNEKS